MSPCKTPGLDGIPPLFYQRYWDIVGPNVVQFVKESFKKAEFEQGLNNVMTTLIPKLEHPELISQFRPISVCNVIIKVISKVVANRLRLILPKLVQETQTSFIPTRQGVDNIVVAQEIIHTKRQKSGRQGLMAFKVDLEKAYDRVEWRFLEQILPKVGFDPHLTNLIMYCLRSTTLKVLWNGMQGEGFQPTRGLRQGDPLAPYLFVLCIEILAQQVQEKVASGKWKSIKSPGRGL